MTDWTNPVVVFVGGGLGALARYGIGRLTAPYPAIQDFPWHTFAINVLGSFALGLVAGWYLQKPTDRLLWYVALGTGFCGGFTTFSTFSVELLAMLEKDRLAAAAVYAGGSIALGLLAAFVALRIMKS
jgi:CrcB protein